MFGFDHDAGELLSPGIAQDDAAVIAQGGLGFGKSSRDFRESVERRLGFNLHVDDDLGIVLEALDEGFDLAVHGNEGDDFDGGEKAVAGRTVFQKDDVAGLLAANDVAAAEHFFENVAIADGGASKSDAFAGKDAFKAEIGHGSGYDAIAFELVLGFQVTGNGEENTIAVNDFSSFANEQGAIGIAIEGNTQLGPIGYDALLQTIQIKRPAACVDIAAVGRDAHGDDICSE